jgi:nitronate monooxygenase
LTRALTGRLARAVATNYVIAAGKSGIAPLPYPIQGALAAAMRAAGASAGDQHRMQLWAGQSGAMAMPTPAADLVHEIWSDAHALLSAKE